MQKRKYTRVQYLNDIEIQYRGKVSHTQSRDLSLRGIRILKPEDMNIPRDSPVILSFTDHNQTTEIEGRLSFADELEWGVVFTKIGENSLKNLIHSVEDSGKDMEERRSIQREIKQMILKVAE